jgi:cell division septal protein FtsQ
LKKPKRNNKTRPKRRRAVSLAPETGAEIRLPAIPAFRVGARLISAVLLCLSVLLIRMVFSDETFLVKSIEVVGNQLLNESQIRSIAGIEGGRVFLLDSSQIEQRIASYPEVTNVEVQIGWPAEVTIEVGEREPVIEWNDANKIWWLSADGVAFLRRDAKPGLVTIASEQPSLVIDRDPNNPVLDLALLRSALELDQLLPEVGQFSYDQAYGLGIMDPGGAQVVFGKSGEMQLKVAIYRALAQHLQNEGLSVEWISVEDPTAPYFRLTG